jgi:hypothetical protein
MTRTARRAAVSQAGPDRIPVSSFRAFNVTIRGSIRKATLYTELGRPAGPIEPWLHSPKNSMWRVLAGTASIEQLAGTPSRKSLHSLRHAP